MPTLRAAGGTRRRARPQRPRPLDVGRIDLGGGINEADEAARHHNAEVTRERIPMFEHRAHLLDVNNRYAQHFLEIQLEWLDEAERVLRGD